MGYRPKHVETRVKEGGHRIPENVIRRRYENGLKNFFTIFKELVDDWMFIDNSGEPYQIIAEGAKEDEEIGNAKIHLWILITCLLVAILLLFLGIKIIRNMRKDKKRESKTSSFLTFSCPFRENEGIKLSSDFIFF